MSVTAVEYALGKGHSEYPLLHASYAPSSRVPSTDFSPWIREQIAAGDTNAVAAYVLQVIQANPGVAVRVEIDAESGALPSISTVRPDSPTWMRDWADQTRAVLDESLDVFGNLDRETELDLRTLMVTHMPHDGTSMFALLRKFTSPLAAAMTPHFLQFRDPGAVVAAANRALHRLRRSGGPWARDEPDLTVEDVGNPGPDGPPPPEIRELPLGSRAHLADIAVRKSARGVGVGADFGTYFDTRAAGCDDEDSLVALARVGLLRPIDERLVVLSASAMSLTASDLRRLLAEGGAQHPKSAAKTRLSQLAIRSVPDQVLEAAGNPRVFELTDKGRFASEWVQRRVVATRRMWAAWAALRES